jgi:hypothetical protein
MGELLQEKRNETEKNARQAIKKPAGRKSTRLRPIGCSRVLLPAIDERVTLTFLEPPAPSLNYPTPLAP